MKKTLISTEANEWGWLKGVHGAESRAVRRPPTPRGRVSVPTGKLRAEPSVVARLPSSASRSRSGSSSGSSSTSSSSLLVRAEGSAPGGIPGPLSLYRSRQTIIRMDSSSLHELDVLWPPLTFITRYRGGSRAILVNSLASSLKVGRIFSSIIQPGGGGEM